MNKKSIAEIQMLSDSDKLMRCRERLEEFHLENMDYVAAIADKWAMLAIYQGGIRL